MSKTDITKTAKELSEILDITDRRVQQLSKLGVIPKVARGRYPLFKAIHGYIKYLRELSLESDAPSDLKDAKLRSEKARAEILELEAATKAGELVHKDHVSKIWTSITSLIKAKTLTLPSRVGADVYATRNLNEVRSILEDAVQEILIELSETEIEIDDTSTNRELSGDSEDGTNESSYNTEADDQSVGGQL